MTERVQITPSDKSKNPVFVLTLAAKPGTDGIQALRALLKLAGRRFGLRCISVEEKAT